MINADLTAVRTQVVRMTVEVAIAQGEVDELDALVAKLDVQLADVEAREATKLEELRPGRRSSPSASALRTTKNSVKIPLKIKPLETDNKRLLSFLDNAVAVSLAITVMSAEVSVAVSSIATGFMIVLAAFRLSIGRNVTWPEKGLFMVFGLWIFAQFLATVFSVHPLESLDNSRKLPLNLVFFTAIIFIKSFGQLRLLLASLFVFTALVSLYELILFNEIWFSGFATASLRSG